MSDTDLKISDLLQFTKICASEYNNPELSDRVLVLDVMQDGWDIDAILNSKSKKTAENEVKGNVGVELSIESDDESKSTDSDSNSDDESINSEDSERMDFTPESTDTILTGATQSKLRYQEVNTPIRQHKLYVHTFWLSVRSPYFRSLFHSSGMKENKDSDVHIKINESEENSYLNLIKAIYQPDTINDKTVDEVLAVLELSHKHDLKYIFKKCKYVLQSKVTKFDIAIKVMNVVKVKHDMADVEDLAITLQLVLAEEFSPLDLNWQNEKFVTLAKPCIKYLLSSDDLIVQSENTVFHALMYWMETNVVDSESLSQHDDLLSTVRFELVTVDYLYNVIRDNAIASKMVNFHEQYSAGMTYHAIPEEQRKLLIKQPTIRKKSEKFIFQHEYNLTPNNFDIAQETELNKLSEFWACGYKMCVGLCHNKNSIFNRYQLRLYINNLKKESLVSLRFAIQKTKLNVRLNDSTFSLESNSALYSCSGQPYIDRTISTLYVAILPQ